MSMSITKNGKILATIVCFLAVVFCLFSCNNVTESPNITAKREAEQNAQSVLTKIIFDEEDCTNVVESVKLATENKNYPGVTISWESSEPDVISTTGSLVRPGFNDERAYLNGENKVVKVVLTAKVVATYVVENNSTKETLSTDPLSKQFTFTVLTLPETIDSGDIKTVKANAWKYVFEEMNADKALVTNNDYVYNVSVKGIVTAKLDDTRGFAIHDGSEGIYVYTTNTNVEVGDTVSVVGGVYSYYGNLQIGKDVSVSVIDPIDGMTIGEYKTLTPQEWETRNAPLGDDVIGYLGGELLKIRGTLKAMDAPNGSSDDYCLVDPFTGEVAWIYYKSYTDEMEALLNEHLGEYVELKGVSFDRDSRLLKNQLLWDGGLEVLEAPVVSDEQRVDSILNPIVLEDSYTQDFDLPEVENGVWSIESGTGIVIENGVAKVTQTNEAQTVVLKVTVTVGDVTKSKEFIVTITAKVEEKGPWSVVTDFKENVAYKLGLVQTKKGQTLYITGEMIGYYFETTESAKEAADVYVVAVEGGYNLKVVKANGTVTYIEIEQSETHINVKFNQTATQVWTYNAELNTFTAVLGDNTYYLGTYGDYTTFSASTVDKAATSYVSHLYEGNATVTTEFEENVAYVLGLVQTKKGQTLYITGEMIGYYFATTEDVKSAADVYVVAVEGGYNLKVVKANGTVTYIEIEQSETHINVKFNQTATQVWTYNAELNTFTAVLGDNTYYLGTYGDYTTFSASTVDKAATSYVSHLYNNPFGPNAENNGGTDTPVEDEKPEVVTEFKENVAYKLGLEQTTAGKTLFLTGAMNGFYFATTETAKEAADVYVVAVEGGYNLKVVKADGTVTYIEVVASGTHINGVFSETATQVWTYNAELNTFVTVLNETTYYLGTYSSFTTMGPSSIDKAETSFVAHLYSVSNADSGETPVVPDTPVVDEPKEVTIKEALELEDGTKVIVKGIVTKIKTAYDATYNNISLYIQDATGELYIYRLVGNYQVGDELKITGVMGSFYGEKQVAAGATAEVLSTGNVIEQPTDCVTISFSDVANRTVFTTEQQVWEQNGITVTNDKASSKNNVADYANPARFYQSSNLTVSYTSAFNKIVIKTAGGKNFSADFTIEGATVTVSGTTCTIEFTDAVTSMTIESLPYQIRVSEIQVYPAA